jgi:diaminopimelate epimerase
MGIPFSKYEGTGNDFIMIDQRHASYLTIDDKVIIAYLCDRRFGIGGDGLILLEHSDQADFKMVYFNADGGQSTMCGNGGRCIVRFAHSLGIFDQECSFEAIDGLHYGRVLEDDNYAVQLIDVHRIDKDEDAAILNTGSPHYVQFVEEIPADIKAAGAAIRYNDTYKAAGINVNFVKRMQGALNVHTYERGVEDETYSCGTGVTAAAIASKQSAANGSHIVHIKSLGGMLKVAFDKDGDIYSNVWLSGPATYVFDGRIEVHR